MKGWRSTRRNEKYVSTHKLRKDFDIREDGMIKKGTLVRLLDNTNVIFLSPTGKPLVHSKLGFLAAYSLDYFEPFTEWFESIS